MENTLYGVLFGSTVSFAIISLVNYELHRRWQLQEEECYNEAKRLAASFKKHTQNKSILK